MRRLPVAALLIVLLPATAGAQAIEVTAAPRDPAPQASAQRPVAVAWFNLGFGGTTDAVDRGFALVSGLSVQVGPVFATLTPMDLALSKGDPSPFFRDSDGVCRDAQGRFADDENCIAIKAAYALTADVALHVPGSGGIIVGVGTRRDGNTNPLYGMIGLQRTISPRSMWSLRVQVGEEYFSGLLGVHFRF